MSGVIDLMDSDEEDKQPVPNVPTGTAPNPGKAGRAPRRSLIPAGIVAVDLSNDSDNETRARQAPPNPGRAGHSGHSSHPMEVIDLVDEPLVAKAGQKTEGAPEGVGVVSQASPPKAPAPQAYAPQVPQAQRKIITDHYRPLCSPPLAQSLLQPASTSAPSAATLALVVSAPAAAAAAGVAQPLAARAPVRVRPSPAVARAAAFKGVDTHEPPSKRAKTDTTGDKCGRLEAPVLQHPQSPTAPQFLQSLQYPYSPHSLPHSPPPHPQSLHFQHLQSPQPPQFLEAQRSISSGKSPLQQGTAPTPTAPTASAVKMERDFFRGVQGTKGAQGKGAQASGCCDLVKEGKRPEYQIPLIPNPCIVKQESFEPLGPSLGEKLAAVEVALARSVEQLRGADTTAHVGVGKRGFLVVGESYKAGNGNGAGAEMQGQGQTPLGTRMPSMALRGRVQVLERILFPGMSSSAIPAAPYLSRTYTTLAMTCFAACPAYPPLMGLLQRALKICADPMSSRWERRHYPRVYLILIECKLGVLKGRLGEVRERERPGKFAPNSYVTTTTSNATTANTSNTANTTTTTTTPAAAAAFAVKEFCGLGALGTWASVHPLLRQLLRLNTPQTQVQTQVHVKAPARRQSAAGRAVKAEKADKAGKGGKGSRGGRGGKRGDTDTDSKGGGGKGDKGRGKATDDWACLDSDSDKDKEEEVLDKEAEILENVRCYAECRGILQVWGEYWEALGGAGVQPLTAKEVKAEAKEAQVQAEAEVEAGAGGGAGAGARVCADMGAGVGDGASKGAGTVSGARALLCDVTGLLSELDNRIFQSSLESSTEKGQYSATRRYTSEDALLLRALLGLAGAAFRAIRSVSPAASEIAVGNSLQLRTILPEMRGRGGSWGGGGDWSCDGHTGMGTGVGEGDDEGYWPDPGGGRTSFGNGYGRSSCGNSGSSDGGGRGSAGVTEALKYVLQLVTTLRTKLPSLLAPWAANQLLPPSMGLWLVSQARALISRLSYLTIPHLEALVLAPQAKSSSVAHRASVGLDRSLHQLLLKLRLCLPRAGHARVTAVPAAAPAAIAAVAVPAVVPAAATADAETGFVAEAGARAGRPAEADAEAETETEEGVALLSLLDEAIDRPLFPRGASDTATAALEKRQLQRLRMST
ncbi:hypothetical protein B484DRAFT_482373 [Ochromonadaceae sp. CCMP2298]|nr:hypothetical protein B484DRAFT_482373 [Ochromonadaceae sp. CCMP2298]